MEGVFSIPRLRGRPPVGVFAAWLREPFAQAPQLGACAPALSPAPAGEQVVSRCVRRADDGKAGSCRSPCLAGAAPCPARRADLVVFGRPFISNPDLVERLRHGWPLAQAGDEALYGGGTHGYTDYPAYVPAAKPAPQPLRA